MIEQAAPAQHSPRRRVPMLRGCGAFVLYLFIVVGWQYWSGAVRAGFGSYPDEPSHYVSGLMLRDYVLSGASQSPVSYAANYYVHLPMIGIGHWPPVFYSLEAGWMLLTGTGRAHVLLLIAIISALVSTTLFLALERRFGLLIGLFAGGWFLAIPVVRWSSNLVMIDVLMSLLVLWAALMFSRYMRTERTRDAIYFGLLAGLALLTKPAAICLVAVPPTAILVSRRFALLRRPGLWLSGIVVFAMIAPWYANVGALTTFGSNPTPWGEHLRVAVPDVFVHLWRETTVLAILSAIGLWVWARGLRKHTDVTAACLLAVIPGTIAAVLAARIPVESRYLIPAYVSMMIFAAYGIKWLAEHVRIRQTPALAGLAGALTLTSALYAGTIHTPSIFRGDDGLTQVVDRLLAEPVAGDRVALVSGLYPGSEGRVIAAIAERSAQRPSDMLLRGTKLLATVDWNGTHYTPRFHTPEEILNTLEQHGVQFVIMVIPERWNERWQHHKLLIELCDKRSDRLQPIGTYPNDTTPGFKLFRLNTARTQKQVPAVMIEELQDRLGSSYGLERSR